MKRILGLDLGTNSIGWALVENDFDNFEGRILGMGSRIIPMTQDIKDDFGRGNSISQTAERTGYRGVRRLRERHLLRRERLHRVLNLMGFLPEHYSRDIDFVNRPGKFKDGTEPKLAYNDSEFIFKSSFYEMLKDFEKNLPELVSDDKLIPYDWTIYYLRKKALIERITKEELAWIILNFNQKRGYYQLRGEEEEINHNKLVEFHSLRIVDVVADQEPNRRGDLWYSLFLENGWVYRRSSKTPLYEWKDKVRDFIVTTDINDDGSPKLDKEGQVKRSFRAPSEEDWALQKVKTEKEIEQSEKTVGEFIYNSLLKNPNQKIRGGLIRTIERKFYKSELITILKKQIELQPELFSNDILNKCASELYKNNITHQNILKNKDFVHLFVHDIIFYQRPLRSQKSNIGRCALEYRTYMAKDGDGNMYEKKDFLRAIPKSHPLFQEFRLWQWIFNLKIYDFNDKDTTKKFVKSNNDIEDIFDFLNNRKSITQEALIKFLLSKSGIKGKELTIESKNYRWNYVEDKEYPCNETRSQFLSRLSKVENIPDDFLTEEVELGLWHIIYSVTDKIEFEKALVTFARKNAIDVESFLENFRRFKPFDSDYGSFSEKAIKKLLPLMRLGKYWDWSIIDLQTKMRIEKIITGEYDETIKDRVREKAINLTTEEHFQGLQLWLAQYVVYDRHSEAYEAGKWDSVDELDKYIKDFEQHSLRNPIVEQVVTETLRVVRDIWIQYGRGEKGFFDEIHIELGREMKNTADERKRLSSIISDNENTNLRLKAMMNELMNDDMVENVRPYSPIQLEALKIYEEGVLKSGVEIPDDILKISQSPNASSKDFKRYKLWLEQKYKSPYTGQIIPLNKLFTTQYQIEHIIPQSRFFDDSLSNKVICESAVNTLKDRQLGFEFIKKHQGEILDIGHGKTIKILSASEYEEFVHNNYRNNRVKRRKLLMDELPEQMIARQLNDTRYISKFISQQLSNIVRSDTNDDGINSKNVLPGNGKVTSKLRQDWGLNNVWNELILPRFERMNELTGTDNFTAISAEGHMIPSIPLELSRGFQKKRIDHRHHALDALVIACATSDHINLLNNQYAQSTNQRYDLQVKLRNKGEWIDSRGVKRTRFTDFRKPWNSFTKEAKSQLQDIIVSFKQNLRVINKTSNKYEKYVEANGEMKKTRVSQVSGENWAIRKPMHKETVSGLVKLRKTKEVRLNKALDDYESIVDKKLKNHIKYLIGVKYTKSMLQKYFKDRENKWENKDISTVDIYYWEEDNVASRVSLDTSFNKNKILKSITDTGIQKILLNHLKNYEGMLDEKGKTIAPEIMAFTPEGIDEMNKNMLELNGGKFHQPIYKVRTYEPRGNKFQVGQTGNKNKKYVEAAKGTNLFFAIYQNDAGKRTYDTIPLNIVIERQKQGLDSVPETNENGDSLLFYLSPNDLVYVPTEDELENINAIDFKNLSKEQKRRIYKMVSSSKKQCFFTPDIFASPIVNKVELSALNKTERTICGVMTKEVCLKIVIDRLGNIQL